MRRPFADYRKILGSLRRRLSDVPGLEDAAVRGMGRLRQVARRGRIDEGVVGADALPPGVMVDVGAHVGSTASPYLARGWRVLAIEPDANNRSRLAARLGHRARLAIEERAVGKRDGERLAWFTSPLSNGINSLIPFHGTHVQTGSVTTATLTTMLEEHGIGHVDVLKLDVEGFDLPALRTYPWETLEAPTLVVSEYEDAKTRAQGYTAADLEQFLRAHGYELVFSEWYPIQRYGSTHRWRRLVSRAAHLDGTGWGNVVAWRPGGEAVRTALERQISRAS